MKSSASDKGSSSVLKNGFSLIELVTVVAILLALSFFAMPTLEIVYVKAREKQLRERLFEIRRAIDAYVNARKNDAKSPYPPTIASLTVPMVDDAKPGANTGPFVSNESLGNPFKDKGDVFLWEIRLDCDPPGTWQLATQANEILQAGNGVYDIRFPEAGVDGWKKAIDDTEYYKW
ncbi:MAG TPA: type II secretion system protein [Candidatus Rifleibacterium sp.]|jgi:prepilin-type N-terminal cleavage/methylation domain-containing protein|nr:type II secretion system protein [Candidatus Rifleibacterium sp.]